jgi:hypothetical protein
MAYITCICLEGLATAQNIRKGIASLVVTFLTTDIMITKLE